MQLRVKMITIRFSIQLHLGLKDCRGSKTQISSVHLCKIAISDLIQAGSRGGNFTIYKLQDNSVLGLPDLQPCLGQLVQTSATRKVILHWDLVALGVEASDVVSESRSHAHPSEEAIVEEFSDAFTPPYILDTQTILKHMP